MALAFLPDPHRPPTVDPHDTFRTEWDEDVRELRFRLAVAAAFLMGVVVVGVVGYRIIEPATGWIDALYMTVITLTTVGFTEIVDLTGHPGGRVFTVVLILFGMGGVLYFVSTATAFVLEGRLGHVFWRRRMEREADRMSGHLIVCGAGSTAIHVAGELRAVRRDLVVVCDEPDRIEHLRAELPGVPILGGDPTMEGVLDGAGVKRAVGVAACTAHDKDNLIVTLTARQMNPSIRIVSMASDLHSERKMRSVGASAVVSPSFIGGLRLASELIRPTVVNFLDIMLRDGDADLRIDEVRIPGGSETVGRRIGELEIGEVSRALLLACRTPDGAWRYNPDPDLVLEADSVLILMGTPSDMAGVADAFDGEMVARPARSGEREA